MTKIAATIATAAVVAGITATGTATAAADPGGWVGPFSSSWTCEQKMSSMGLKIKPCTYGKTSRGTDYYFYFRP